MPLMDTFEKPPALDIVDDRMPRHEEVLIPEIESVRSLLGDRYGEHVHIHFPDIEPPTYPTGLHIIVQLFVPTKTLTFKGGKKIWLPDETVTSNQARAQTALVRAVGPAAYRHRQTLRLWPEGHWCVPGMFIRVPMYGGDRMEVPFDRPDGSGDSVLFVIFRDQDCLSVVRGDPTTIKVS
jgi:hypothetical protein